MVKPSWFWFQTIAKIFTQDYNDFLSKFSVFETGQKFRQNLVDLIIQDYVWHLLEYSHQQAFFHFRIYVRGKRIPLVKKLCQKVLTVIYFEFFNNSSSDCSIIVITWTQYKLFRTKMKLLTRLFFLKKSWQLANLGYFV